MLLSKALRSLRTAIVASMLVATALAPSGCMDAEDDPAQQEPATAQSGASGLAVTVGCENRGPGSDWRRQGVSVSQFGLLVHDLRDARRLRNGNYLVKMGAVVEGQEPVTVRVPEAAQQRVRLIYGDATENGREIPPSPVKATFLPCPDLPRSGYVGGLLLKSVSEPVSLEIFADGSTEVLTIEPSGSRARGDG